MGYAFSGKRTSDARTLLRDLAIGEAKRKVTAKDEQGIPGNELDIFAPRDEAGLSRSFYLYHGNPIAMYDPYIERFFVSTYGWDDSITTRKKIDDILGDAHLDYKRDRKTHEITLTVRGEPFTDSEELFRHLLCSDGIHVMNSWRRWVEPFTAVAGCNDTGSWSDSPCPTSLADKEVERLLTYLRSKGFKPYQCYTQTSNVFCVARYICVPLHQVIKAREAIAELELRTDYTLAYDVQGIPPSDTPISITGGYK